MDQRKAEPAHLRDIKNFAEESSSSLFTSNIFSKELLSAMKERVQQSDESRKQAKESITISTSRRGKRTRKRYVDVQSESDEDCVVLSQSSTGKTHHRSPTKRLLRSAKSAAPGSVSSQSHDEIQPSDETLQILQKLQKMENLGCVELSDDSSDSVTCLGEAQSPVKKEKIVIVVKCQSRLLNYSTSPEAPFGDILQKVAEECGVDASQVTLFFKTRPVRPDDTPESLHLAAADILECFTTKYRETGAMKNAICIKFQCSNKRKNESITVSSVKPIREGARVLAEKLGLRLSQLTFKFDGESVNLESTPEELGIEDNDCVDVCIH